MLTFLVESPWWLVAGIVVAFVLNFILTAKGDKFLPRDQGREYAFNGKLSAGKPRGAGIIFTVVFLIASLVFVHWNLEVLSYLTLILVEMLTGYLDDASDKPWGELKKGLLDFAVAILTAFTYLHFNPSAVELALFGTTLEIHPVIFGVLTVILVWASVNVTNCADGVDGLSGTLTLVTLGSFFALDQIRGTDNNFAQPMVIFMVCILSYLWFNATPSKLMMGDAGSRAMGIVIAIAALKSHCPLIYLIFAILLIVDGGSGLVKVALLRYLKIAILKKTKTPIHDHVRKEKEWSNTQTVTRFAILQLILNVAVLYAVSLV